jgi:poly(3-hydroxybutyrate) depolymerase
LALAKKHNFALLLPKQSLSNNIQRCFNWYSADYFTRDLAGGAMASGMLANYPALFTSGAVVAGIPFPCAEGLMTGFRV